MTEQPKMVLTLAGPYAVRWPVTVRPEPVMRTVRNPAGGKGSFLITDRLDVHDFHQPLYRTVPLETEIRLAPVLRSPEARGLTLRDQDALIAKLSRREASEGDMWG